MPHIDRRAPGATSTRCVPELSSGDVMTVLPAVTFPGGPPPTELLSNEGVQLQQFVGGKNGKKRAVVAVTDGTKYRGTVVQSNSTCKYLVGVYKADKNKLYLVDAGQVCIS